jgi:RimJ/RimL family protein N-acetyltransferase
VTESPDRTTTPPPIHTPRPSGDRKHRSAPVPSIRLRQLSIDVLEPYLIGLDDPEISRLTGTRGTFSRQVVEQWLLTRAAQTDRVDWAVHRRSDDEFLGEAVLNDIDLDNRSASFRVWLLPAYWGQGHGTEVATLALAHAFQTLNLHRVELSVFAFNPRAQRAYEKAGFTVEGRRRHALRWDDTWHDDLIMAALNPASP